ncbi:hypothetical protein [Streptomyces sp. NPDC051997]|uniref:hypothetical protein n=1 Tax=Streptomyces sp. NPDC051997 TaxID=3155611 RepID=UPI00343D12E4
MSRLSREQKRELKRQRSAAGAGGQPAAGTTPIEVHVPASADAVAGAAAPGAAGARGCATVGGMPVVAAPGETVQGAILGYLHRLALATGHPVLASIHDERIGYVVPLQVHVDGSSRYTAEPVRVAPPAHHQPVPPQSPGGGAQHGAPRQAAPEHRAPDSGAQHRAPRPQSPDQGAQHRAPQRATPEHRPQPQAPERHPQAPVQEQRSGYGAAEHPRSPAQEHPRSPALEHPRRPSGEVPQAPVQGPPQPPAQRRPEEPAAPLPPVPVSAEAPLPPVPVPAEAPAPAAPRRDKATYVLRAVPEPGGPVRARESGVPTTPAASQEAAPAPVHPPTGRPAPESPARPEFAPRPQPAPEPAVTAEFVPHPVPEPPLVPESRPTPVRGPEQAEYVPHPVPEPPMRPEPQPAPVRRPESQPAPARRSEPAVTAEFVPQSQPTPMLQPESQPAPARRSEPAVTAEFVPQLPQSQPAPSAPSVEVPASAPAPAAMGEPVFPVDGTGPAGEGSVPGADQAPPAEQPAAPGTPTPSTFVLRAVPEPRPLPGAASTRVLRAVPESAAPAVSAPTGAFGPAPVTGTTPEPKPAREAQAPAPASAPAPEAQAPAPERKPVSAMEALSLLGPEPEPDPKPTPARGFDAVAEAVLGAGPQGPAPERDPASAFLAEPVARINEAVKMGRIEAAAGMAERAVTEAAHSLGQEHPEVLKLRELTAYIAYLAGDALRSFHLSLDLARVRRRHRDTGAAYGNVQSAAAAWRAVRDPLQGLHLGRDLIGLWTELAADDGPAADDLEQLESARTRMARLAERARVAAENPYTRTPRAHGE